MNAAFILGAQAFADVYGDDCVQAIKPAARLLSPPLTTEQLALAPPPWLGSVDVLFTGWDGPRLDATLLARMPRLRAVFYGAGSIRAIASDALWDSGVIIASAAALNALPVIEFTFGAILLSFKRAWHHARNVREQRGFVPLRALPVPTGSEATIGLVSLGLIGAGVAERLLTCDARVLAHDPLLPPERFAELGAEPVPLDELFERADVLSVHAPLLPETTGFIDRRLLDRMKPNATFINTARGALVREHDLTEFLRDRPDVQALLDVTDPEPPAADSPLYDLPNVFLTPHIAGSIGAERRRMGRAMIEELHRFVRGESLHYAVTREQFARMARGGQL
jgi:phosphoglycerate dehydrogenase-like enzyme